jgi:hypothetical protein
MLRMRLDERLFANVCFTKECDLKFFDDHSFDSKNVTSTRQTILQNKINDDDDFIIILLNVFWNMKESSNHDDNSQIKRCILEHIFEILKFRNLRISNFSSNEDDHDSQVKSFAADLNHLSDNVLSTTNFSRFFEIESIHSKKYKRQRFLIVDSTKNSFDKYQIKRRSSEVRFIQILVSHVIEISNRCLEHDDQSNQFCITYDAVLAFLTNVLRIKSQVIDIDDHISTLIQKFNEFLTRYEIIEMRFISNDFSDHDIVATRLNNQKIILVNLIFFKSMSFIANLTSYLFHLMQLQSLQSASKSMISVNDFFLSTCIVTNDKRFQNWTINNINSYVSISISRQYKLTFSSALLNDINFSNCSTII